MQVDDLSSFDPDTTVLHLSSAIALIASTWTPHLTYLPETAHCIEFQ